MQVKSSNKAKTFRVQLPSILGVDPNTSILDPSMAHNKLIEKKRSIGNDRNRNGIQKFTTKTIFLSLVPRHPRIRTRNDSVLRWLHLHALLVLRGSIILLLLK